MKLTIGIPNYNGGELLKLSVLSCKNAGLPENEYEILILDNCSTDSSERFVNELKKEIGNLHFKKNDKNYGRIGNRNRVLEEAKGEYILFLMVGDTLEKSDYSKTIFSENHDRNLCYVFSFFKGTKKKVDIHFAQDLNIILDVDKVQKVSIETLGHNYGYPILQSFFLSKETIKNNFLKFDENLSFLADLKFLHEYVEYFERIEFLDIPNINWGTGLGKFTFKNQLSMFRDFLSYYPWAFKKFLKRDINLVQLKLYLSLHIFFTYLNNFRMGNKGFSFCEMLYFIRNDLGNVLYIFIFLFEPFYIIYLFVNLRTNFKYVIKF